MIQALEIHMAPGNDDYQAVWRRVIPALSDESTVWQADRLDLPVCVRAHRETLHGRRAARRRKGQ